MRSVSVRLSDIGKIVVPIGFVGENMRTTVYIDCKKVFDEYPNAEARLTVYSPGGIAYPASVTRNSDIVEWIISDADLIDHGTGEYQLSFINENTVVKSYIGKTKVLKSIVPTGDIPSPIENWIIRAENTLDSIPDAIQSDLNDAMAEITAQAQNLQPGSSATAYYDTNNKVIIFGIPEGMPGTNGTNGIDGIDGQDGYSPIATVTKQGSTAIITIQDANGTTSASVTDGADGVDGITPSFSIGTVETVSPDTDASATITGTDENPVLNLSIPRGVPGEVTESELTEALSEKADIINITDDNAENVKSFTDGAKDQPMAVSIKMEPIRDLHGYDNPWPAGGGKNKFDKDTAVLDVRIGIDGQEVSDPGYYASDYIPVTVGTTYVKNSPVEDAYHRFAVYASDKSFLRVANDTQQTITIYENESYIRICGLQTELDTVQVEVGTESSDYATYSNICPISGWSSVKINRTGRNLLNIDDLINAPSGIMGTYTFKHLLQIPLNPNTAYTLYTSFRSNANVIYFNGTSVLNCARAEGPVTITTDDTGIVKVGLYDRDGIESFENKSVTVQIEEGSSPLYFYEPFGETYEITIPSTTGAVYGGTLTINKDGTGKLTVKKVGKTIGSMSWSKSQAGNYFITSSATDKTTYNAGVISDTYRTVPVSSSTTETDYIIKGVNATSTQYRKQIIIKDTRYTTPEEFVSAMGNSVIVYTLHSYNIYTLTAEQVNIIITSLKGLNSIFVYSGSINSVDYSADTQLYIDNHNTAEDDAIESIKTMIADSDTPVATVNHAIGDVFICNNALYCAKDIIIAGETITTGSGGNSEIINLTDYISEKNAALQALINTNTSHVTNFRKIYPTPEAPLEKFGDDFENMTSYGVLHSKIGNVYYLQGKNSSSTYRNYSWHCGVVKPVSSSSSVPGYNEDYMPFTFQSGVRHCIKIHFPKYYEVGADSGRVIVRLLKADSEHAQSFTSICTADGYDHEYYFTPSDGDRYGFIMYVRSTTMDMAIEVSVFSAPENI